MLTPATEGKPGPRSPGSLGPGRTRRLTRRQTECLSLLAEGYSVTMIAAQLGIAPPTVAQHLKSAKERLAVRTRMEAVALALESDSLRPNQAGESIGHAPHQPPGS